MNVLMVHLKRRFFKKIPSMFPTFSIIKTSSWHLRIKKKKKNQQNRSSRSRVMIHAAIDSYMYIDLKIYIYTIPIQNIMRFSGVFFLWIFNGFSMDFFKVCIVYRIRGPEYHWRVRRVRVFDGGDCHSFVLLHPTHTYGVYKYCVAYDTSRYFKTESHTSA